MTFPFLGIYATDTFINTHVKCYVYQTFYAALFKEFSLEVAKMPTNQ